MSDLNEHNELNEQMLSAASKGDYSTVEQLVQRGADINNKNQWGTFAMFTAAWEGDVNALDTYQRLGAELFYEDANLLCNAAYNGQTASVKWLLDNGADPDFVFSETGENALHYTISKTTEMEQRTEIVKLLIEAGTNVHQKTNPGVPTLCFMRDALLKGETPLHRAAAYANVAIVQHLLDSGADPKAKDANGDTPISWGSWYLRDSDLLKLLLYDGVARIS